MQMKYGRRLLIGATAGWALGFSAAGPAQPLWSVYPGFFSPGGAGIVAADLDGDGIDEAVVTGDAGVPFMAVLQASPDAARPYRVVHLRRLASGEAFLGPILKLPGSSGIADRIVATIGTSMQARTVQYAGPALEPLTAAPTTLPFRQSAVADVDADGDLELIGTLGESWFSAPVSIRSLASGAVEWTDTIPSAAVGVGQLDADPALELVVSQTGNSNGRILDGASRAVQWTYPDGFGGRIAFGNFLGSPADREFAVVETWGKTRIFVSQPSFSPVREYDTGEIQAVTVRDIDGDQLDDLIVGQGQWGAVIAYNTATGQSIRSFSNPEHGVSAVAVGQFDGDPGLELVHGAGLTSSGRDVLRILSIADGQEEMTLADEAGPHSSVAMGDLDGDGSEEVVYATLESDSGYAGINLHVLNAASGTLLRSRNNVMEAWGANPGASIRLINLDSDPQLEIVVGLSQNYSARLMVLDGISLADQWARTLDGEAVADVLVVDRSGSPALALAIGGRVLLLDAITGTELWRSVSFLVTGSQTLVAGNLDADANPEIALSVGMRAYVLDPVTGLLDRIIDPGSTILGQRIESSSAGCLHVIVLTTELRRLRCATGDPESRRSLPFTATLVAFPGDSRDVLVVGDGSRIRLDGNGVALAEQGDLGPLLGWGNRAIVRSGPERVDVIVGSSDSVHRVRLPAPLFRNGFE